MRKSTYTCLIGVVLLALCGLNVFGEIIVGTKKGISLSSAYSIDSQPGFDRVILLGFDGGIFTEIALSRRFSLETGLLFAQRGLREEGDGFSYTWLAGYLDIPLLTKVKFTFLDGTLRASLLLGPQIAIALGSEYHQEPSGGGGSTDDPKVQPVDVGFTIGAEGGVRLAEAYYFFLDVRYFIGFLPVVDPDDTQGQTPRASMFSVLAGLGFKLF